MDAEIELQNVTLISEDFSAIEDVSVVFPRGKSTVIMGPSGCGKSTLLKVAAGLLVPDRGRVYVAGRRLLDLSDRELMEFRRSSGFMFQDGALWANKSVHDNLALPIEYHEPGQPPAEVRRRVLAQLRTMGLDDSIDLRPAQLSTGEQKLVSFLRATVLEPSLLFLDDPTTSIDHASLQRMMQRIEELHQRGCTIIAVTHDAHLAAMIANHLVVLKAGRVLEAADLAVVRRSTNPQVIEILTQVLSDAAAYDTDILDLLGDGDTPSQ
ncbi:MAG: ATP-binding cassette domain-containing protein [Spirochaetales bacterium]|nr:ATP-binding cassette domain-containing protein [Spirochaetales bacterium]